MLSAPHVTNPHLIVLHVSAPMLPTPIIAPPILSSPMLAPPSYPLLPPPRWPLGFKEAVELFFYSIFIGLLSYREFFYKKRLCGIEHFSLTKGEFFVEF